MAEKQNYYYLKLKENFFEEDEIKILESMENGYLYSNILLKLYLKALKNNGKLVFNEYIPYDAKMLATITGHNIAVVEKAITIFKQMHLIEILDNGAIYMLNIQNMLGSISSEGIRKAEYRERIKMEKEKSGTSLGQSPDIISISNSSSNSISISNSNNKEKKSKEFIPPTLEEVKEYASSRDRLDLAKKFFDYYEAGKWIDGKGNKVKNWKQKFITWEMKDNKPKQQEQIEEKPDLTKRRFDTDGVELFYVEGKWYRLDSQMFKFGLTCLEDGRCIQNGKLL